MNYVIFENEGEIDLRAIRTFGVSVKENENPIGYFGTGLKYAIAILLRHDHEVTCLAGEQIFRFDVKPVDMRGKEFKVITMNGEELPFTTELGKNWELWQAFREIYCNCLDEKGEVDTRMFMPRQQAGKTFFIVKGREFENLYHDRKSIVLDLDQRLKVSSGDVDVYNKTSEFIYYRGIRVASLDSKTRLTYNITAPIMLTEDRTVKYEHEVTGKIPVAIARMKDKHLIREVLTCDREFYEHMVGFESLTWHEEVITKEFEEVCAMEYNFNNDHMNKSARDFWAKRMQKAALKNYEPVEMSEVERKQLRRCQEICRKLYDDFDRYEILVVKTLGQSTLAMADLNRRAIVLSRRSFELGTKFLLATMIEEYAHLKTGYRDHTRELQTWLFDQICTVVENHVLHEPI